MTAIQNLVRLKLRERGMSMHGASLKIGKNHAYLQQFIERGKPAALPESVRDLLGPLLGVEPSVLKLGGPTQQSSPLPSAPSGESIPVMGVGQRGTGDPAHWMGAAVEQIARPPALGGTPDGYAVYIFDDTMVPRYHPGEVVYINPARPVSSGDYVLVVLVTEGDEDARAALIARLDRATGDKLHLATLNPYTEFTLKRSTVESVHRIVGSSSL